MMSGINTKRYSGSQLSAFTQQSGTTWRKAIDNNNELLKDEDILEEKNFL